MNRKLHQNKQRSNDFRSTNEAGLQKEMKIVLNYHVMLQVEVPGKPSGFMDKIPLCLSTFVFKAERLPEFSSANLLLLLSWGSKTFAI